VAPVTIGQEPARAAERPARFAGDYRIDTWRSLERRGILHVFQLNEDGAFLVGAEWPDHERSRFTGTWSFSGGRIVLRGEGEVWTNQGSWQTPFLRAYAVDERESGIRLIPVPEKNRYGLVGWPNAFVRLGPLEGAASRE
jgi:hypothetical protein